MLTWRQRLRPIILVLVMSVFATPILSKGEIEVPFPWGKEVPFPWKHIEGTWNYDDAYGKFDFKVINQHQDGTRVVQVIEYDETGGEKGRGLGVAGPGNRIVRAIMQSENGAYMLLIRAFNDVKQCARGKLVVVVTIRSLNPETQRKDFHHVINKQTDNPICGEWDQNPQQEASKDGDGAEY